jgi:hypothetical protein
MMDWGGKCLPDRKTSTRRDQREHGEELPADRPVRIIFIGYDIQVSGWPWIRYRYRPASAICKEGVVIGPQPRDVPGIGVAAHALGIHAHARLFKDTVQDNLHFIETKLRNGALRRAVKTYGHDITSQQLLDALGSKARLVPIEHITKVTLTPLKGQGGHAASTLMEFEAPEIGRFASRAPLTVAMDYLEEELRSLVGNRLMIRSDAGRTGTDLSCIRSLAETARNASIVAGSSRSPSGWRRCRSDHAGFIGRTNAP